MTPIKARSHSSPHACSMIQSQAKQPANYANQLLNRFFIKSVNQKLFRSLSEIRNNKKYWTQANEYLSLTTALFTQFTELNWLDWLAPINAIAALCYEVIEWSRMSECAEFNEDHLLIGSTHSTGLIPRKCLKNGMVLMKNLLKFLLLEPWSGQFEFEGIKDNIRVCMQIKGWPFITLYISLRMTSDSDLGRTFRIRQVGIMQIS